MTFNPYSHRYPSRRNLVFAKKGVVATGQPLAAEAGLEILKKGGNAVDAAVATAACLTVVEPASNGIGGDAFCMVCVDGRLYGLNSSGPAPQNISIEALKDKGYKEIPPVGWPPVTVPGIPAAWASLIRRFGKLPLSEVLKPAIRYASEGYPISPELAENWGRRFEWYKRVAKDEIFKHWFDTFAPKGRAPIPGELWKCEAMADTLREIGQTQAESFYRGTLAEKIVNFSRQTGGFFELSDLEAFKPEWVEPLHINYRGMEVWELPPNGQGLVALVALNILKNFEMTDKEDPRSYHLQIEAIKLAFADGLSLIGDPKYFKTPIEEMLSENYSRKRSSEIGERAKVYNPGVVPGSNTVYLATADEEGNMVSYIQSNYMGFGSGLVVPGTGIALHNRGHCFVMDPRHPNALAPGKRPYHTIIPGFLTRDGSPVGPFGIMGGYMQPQAHVQVLSNLLDFHLNPQEALDAPRWQWIKDNVVSVEYGTPENIAAALSRMGHDVKVELEHHPFGRGQIIWKTEHGSYCCATEPRTDGHIAVW